MIPLFKSQFSVGRSILTLDNIINIAEINSLEEVVLVEDSFYGFRKFNEAFRDRSIKLIFGIRLPVINDESDEVASKLIFFAKNNKGMKKIRDLYTKAYVSTQKALVLGNHTKEDFLDIKVAVPFYDSYIYNNLFHFGMSNLNLDNLDHVYFLEDNKHPFDFQLRRAIEDLSDTLVDGDVSGIKTIPTKSIFYKNKDDFHAFQMYKAVCNRSGGRSPVFHKPNLDHFCSDEFCWESYKDATV